MVDRNLSGFISWELGGDPKLDLPDTIRQSRQNRLPLP